jgi:hypothetical protein
MSTPDIRTALERLVELEDAKGAAPAIANAWTDAIAAARAVLAAEPVVKGPTNDELLDLARAIIDHWNPPATPAPEPGEVADSVEWLGVVSEQFRLAGLGYEAEQTDRVATLLQQPPAPAPAVVPVAVSERLPGEGDCDAEGRCWLLTFEDGFPQWRLHSIEGHQPGGHMIWIPVDKAPGVMVDAFYTSHWLPAHAIPLPQAGERE